VAKWDIKLTYSLVHYNSSHSELFYIIVLLQTILTQTLGNVSERVVRSLVMVTFKACDHGVVHL